MDTKRLFNDGWEFTKQSLGQTIAGIMTDIDVVWTPVDIPHDFLIWQTKDLYENCEGWYRKRFSYVPSLDRVYIRFDGAYMNTTVYVNGEEVGNRKYGYVTFEFDITDFLTVGENEIHVSVIYESPNTRWYSGAGIYRNVWLISRHPFHIASDSLYVSTQRIGTNFEVTASALATCDGILCFRVLDAEGNDIANAIKECFRFEQCEVSMTVYKPTLWTLEIPRLYKVEASLVVDGEEIDDMSCNIGFRTFEFTTDRGLFMNDRHIKIKGVCMHHDLGALGAAFNPVAAKRQLSIMRTMGVNAIRTAHNMPAPEIMDLCDEMGFLVMNEAFDMWELPKTEFDYHRFFPDCFEEDVKNWIRRDYNHPSLLMWSIGNEIADVHRDPERGAQITRKLIETVRKYDFRGNAPITFASNYMPWEGAQKSADLLKYVGYNYAEYLYQKHHEEHPDWIIFGSETASNVASRGIYHFPLSQPILCDDDEQCSALGNSTTSWGSENCYANIFDDRDCEFSLGQFIWSGFDYIGEPTPYQTKNSYFGQVDTAGFPKDSYYMYQAEWTDYRYAPMIHICPYWDFSDGQMIDVRVISNAPKIELYFNDELVDGPRNIDHEKSRHTVCEYRMPYQNGKLLAIAYDEFDNELCREERRSFGNATQIVLTPDRTSMNGDGVDMIFVEISMIDMEGNPVENANNRVNVYVTGAGRLVGLDNGDSTDYDEYKGTSRRLFSGKLLAMIASKQEEGDIYVQVTSPSLPDASVTLYARKAEPIPGISCQMENIESTGDILNEIPVRKIAIISPSGFEMSPEQNTIELHAALYPENTSYFEFRWKATDINGVPTKIAKITPDPMNPLACTVTALGDGVFQVRLATKNGGDKVDIYTSQTFTVTGMGAIAKDPYDFISAGFHEATFGKITIGNERGIATDREGDSGVTFGNIDFGEKGSSRIQVSIFELASEPIDFEIYKGKREDGVCLGTFHYHKKSIWNTYQVEEYDLPEKLCGVQELTFVFHEKVHFKGFIFKQENET